MYRSNKVVMIKKDGAKIESVWKDGKLVSPKNK
jgi:hypothetical protein